MLFLVTNVTFMVLDAFIAAVDEQNAQTPSSEDFLLPFTTEDGKEHIVTTTVNVHSGNALPRIRGSSRGNFPYFMVDVFVPA